jgi:hypothetical protein
VPEKFEEMNKKLDELEKNPRNGGVYLHNPPLEEK